MKKNLCYRIYSIVWLGTLLLIGCNVSKNTAELNTNFPDIYRGAPSDTIAVGTLAWKEFFRDSTLKLLIADALIHNNDLQIAIKNIETAALTLRQAKLGNLPIVGFQINALANRPSDNSLNGLTLDKFLQTKHIEDYNLGPVFSWEADLWGKIRSQKAVAHSGFLQNEESRKILQTRIVSDISKSYFNLLMLTAQLGIAKKNIALNDSTLVIVKLQYDAGQVSSLAIQQADAQRLDAAKLIPDFEQQIEVQENAISILSGRNPQGIKTVVILDSFPEPEFASAGLPSKLLSRRPDVKFAELAFSKANYSVGYAKANMYPSLTITAQAGLDAFKASNWFNIPASLFGAAAGSIIQPVFQQRRLRTQYEIAIINREQSVIRFRQSVLVAVGEVSDALVKIDKLHQKELISTERTATLKTAISNARLLFGNGMANYLEVLTAQSNLLQSELELAFIKKARLDASVDLYRSVGGGWN